MKRPCWKFHPLSHWSLPYTQKVGGNLKIDSSLEQEVKKNYNLVKFCSLWIVNLALLRLLKNGRTPPPMCQHPAPAIGRQELANSVKGVHWTWLRWPFLRPQHYQSAELGDHSAPLFTRQLLVNRYAIGWLNNKLAHRIAHQLQNMNIPLYFANSRLTSLSQYWLCRPQSNLAWFSAAAASDCPMARTKLHFSPIEQCKGNPQMDFLHSAKWRKPESVRPALDWKWREISPLWNNI